MGSIKNVLGSLVLAIIVIGLPVLCTVSICNHWIADVQWLLVCLVTLEFLILWGAFATTGINSKFYD